MKHLKFQQNTWPYCYIYSISDLILQKHISILHILYLIKCEVILNLTKYNKENNILNRGKRIASNNLPEVFNNLTETFNNIPYSFNSMPEAINNLTISLQTAKII